MKVILFSITIVFGLMSSAQDYEVYSNDTLQLNSDLLGESITLNIHKPETLDLSNDKISYPITIIFDSHHEMTYPRLIRTFDFLTIEALMPETLIVGIPFNYKNRTYLTSNQRKRDDDLLGMERLEQFVFKELIPKLKSDYKANDFLMLVGHSRTAFFVNYLLTQHSSDIDVAIALSGFFKEPPLNNGAFEEFLSANSNFSTPTKLYHTVGTSEEEAPYKKQYDTLNTYLKENGVADNLDYNYVINPHATHMVNYWMSMPQILLSGYSTYGKLINDWLFFKLEDESLKKPIEVFENDLKVISSKMGIKVNPSLTHIISFANHYFNTQQFGKAIGFLKLGIEYYPEYLDFYSLLIECLDKLEDIGERSRYLELYKSRIENNTKLSQEDKMNLLKDY